MEEYAVAFLLGIHWQNPPDGLDSNAGYGNVMLCAVLPSFWRLYPKMFSNFFPCKYKLWITLIQFWWFKSQTTLAHALDVTSVLQFCFQPKNLHKSKQKPIQPNSRPTKTISPPTIVTGPPTIVRSFMIFPGDASWPRAGGMFGELLASEALRRQLGGLVVDGNCRDLPLLRQMSLPIFHRGQHPNAGTAPLGTVEKIRNKKRSEVWRNSLWNTVNLICLKCFFNHWVSTFDKRSYKDHSRALLLHVIA